MIRWIPVGARLSKGCASSPTQGWSGGSRGGAGGPGSGRRQQLSQLHCASRSYNVVVCIEVIYGCILRPGKADVVRYIAFRRGQEHVSINLVMPLRLVRGLFRGLLAFEKGDYVNVQLASSAVVGAGVGQTDSKTAGHRVVLYRPNRRNCCHLLSFVFVAFVLDKGCHGPGNAPNSSRISFKPLPSALASDPDPPLRMFRKASTFSFVGA